MTYVDPAAIRAYIADACRTLAMLPIPKGGIPAENLAWWPETLREFHESYGREPPKHPRLRPSPEAIDRLNAVLPWIYSVADIRARKVLIARGLGAPWRKIGLRLGCSKDTARRLEERALVEIACSLGENTQLLAQVG